MYQATDLINWHVTFSLEDCLLTAKPTKQPKLHHLFIYKDILFISGPSQNLGICTHFSWNVHILISYILADLLQVITHS